MSSRVPTLLASGWSGAKMLPPQTKSKSSLACSRVSASSLPSFLAANKHRGFPQSLQVTTSRTLVAVTGTFCVSVSAVVAVAPSLAVVAETDDRSRSCTHPTTHGPRNNVVLGVHDHVRLRSNFAAQLQWSIFFFFFFF